MVKNLSRACLATLLFSYWSLYAQSDSTELEQKSGIKTYAGYCLKDALRFGTAPLWWKGNDWARFGALATGTGILVWRDEEIRKTFQRSRTGTTNHAAKGLNFLGGPGIVPVLVGTLAAGTAFRQKKLQAAAIDGWEASGFAFSCSVVIKTATSRARPFQNEGVWKRERFSTSSSFPSGHTAQAFALATVISSYYHKPWVKILCYGLAASVGLARMNDDKHFASDVLVGAALGTTVARTICKRNQARRASRSKLHR